MNMRFVARMMSPMYCRDCGIDIIDKRILKGLQGSKRLIAMSRTCSVVGHERYCFPRLNRECRTCKHLHTPLLTELLRTDYETYCIKRSCGYCGSCH